MITQGRTFDEIVIHVRDAAELLRQEAELLRQEKDIFIEQLLPAGVKAPAGENGRIRCQSAA